MVVDVFLARWEDFNENRDRTRFVCGSDWWTSIRICDRSEIQVPCLDGLSDREDSGVRFQTGHAGRSLRETELSQGGKLLDVHTFDSCLKT